jgi:putative oxidoreductase
MPKHLKATLMTPFFLKPSKATGLILWLRDGLDARMNALQPLASLLARLYMAQVFFTSGLTKLRDWDITLALFMDEYKVPLLSPELAAWAGTAGELVLPVLLALGLGGRVPALGLGVLNAVAVVSLMEVAPAALQQHITWAVLLGGLAIFGSGRWSADRIFGAKTG